jgi:hypothetical protein
MSTGVAFSAREGALRLWKAYSVAPRKAVGERTDDYVDRVAGWRTGAINAAELIEAAKAEPRTFLAEPSDEQIDAWTSALRSKATG